jgi:hypothetical protein
MAIRFTIIFGEISSYGYERIYKQMVALLFYFSSGYYHNAIPAKFETLVLAFTSFCCNNICKGFKNHVD